ncbi:MAG: DEAD/DEAH box helicase, partial [Bacteroidota bacterium]
RDFIVTSGTGSGKSLTYIGTIFHHLLSHPSEGGIRAVIVYPMNALINSQFNELKGYQEYYEKTTGRIFPFTFGQYTGQEKAEQRQALLEENPDILLTNYMMLELILTRSKEASLKNSIHENLRFLAFDELHTFRGRQGSDVALLIRRIKSQSKNNISCIGTSATMVSGGTLKEQREVIANVATTFFGSVFTENQIISEKIIRSLSSRAITTQDLQQSINEKPSIIDESFIRSNKLIQWLEQKIALDEKEGVIIRNKPKTLNQISEELAKTADIQQNDALQAIIQALEWLSIFNVNIQDGVKPILPFKIHQFIAQTGSVYITLDERANRIITLEPGSFITDEENNKKPIYPIVFSRE